MERRSEAAARGPVSDAIEAGPGSTRPRRSRRRSRWRSRPSPLGTDTRVTFRARGMVNTAGVGRGSPRSPDRRPRRPASLEKGGSPARDPRETAPFGIADRPVGRRSSPARRLPRSPRTSAPRRPTFRVRAPTWSSEDAERDESEAQRDAAARRQIRRLRSRQRAGGCRPPCPTHWPRTAPCRKTPRPRCRRRSLPGCGSRSQGLRVVCTGCFRSRGPWRTRPCSPVPRRRRQLAGAARRPSDVPAAGSHEGSSGARRFPAGDPEVVLDRDRHPAEAAARRRGNRVTERASSSAAPAVTSMNARTARPRRRSGPGALENRHRGRAPCTSAAVSPADTPGTRTASGRLEPGPPTTLGTLP